MKTYLNPVTGESHPLDLENPAPGIYQGVSHADYLKINAVSRSSLFAFGKAPELYLHGDDETSEAMTIGTQYHAFLLQPDEWASEFVEGPECVRSAADKERRLALQAEYGVDNVYRPSTLEKFEAMKKALDNYPKQKQVLIHKSERELVVIARHDQTGLMLKIKIDSPKIAAGWMIDLKTSGDHPFERHFNYSANEYGYKFQAGFYALVCSLTPGLEHVQNFEIIAQGKKPPYIVRAYNMQEHINPNILEANLLLLEFAKWSETRRFPDDMIILPNYSF